MVKGEGGEVRGARGVRGAGNGICCKVVYCNV